MLLEQVKKFYDVEQYNLNCAETILYAANEEYSLGLDAKAFKTMSAFGGGMAIEGVCGALSGALAVIGIMYTEKSAHTSPKVKELTVEYIKQFENALKTTNCKELKILYRNDEIRCGYIVEKAAELLEELINKNK